MQILIPVWNMHVLFTWIRESMKYWFYFKSINLKKWLLLLHNILIFFLFDGESTCTFLQYCAAHVVRYVWVRLDTRGRVSYTPYPAFLTIA